MSSLVFGGVAIPVNPTSVKRDYLDGTDRQRAFDQTYRLSVTGTPKREWTFSTPPVARGRMDYYETILQVMGAQSAAGEIIGANELLQPLDPANAAWTKVGVTVSGVVTDPFGGNLAKTLTATAPDASFRQFLADSTSDIRTNSLYIRRRTGTGVIDFYNPLDAGSSAPVPTASWQRFTNTGGASILRKFELIIRTSGDELDIYGPQLEEGSSATTFSATASPVSCYAEIVDWRPVSSPSGHLVVLDFKLCEA